MKKSRFSEEQIIGVLKQHEAGVKTAELCREHGISATFLPSIRSSGQVSCANKKILSLTKMIDERTVLAGLDCKFFQ